jgi:hypothetical protein
MIFAVDLHDSRTNVTYIAQRRRLPFDVTGPFVISHHTGLWSLRSDNEQIAVDQRTLGNGPDQKSACGSSSTRVAATQFSTEIGPNVLIPNRFVCGYVDAVEITVVSAGIDVIPINGRHTARAGETNGPGRIIGEIPEFLATGKVKTAKAGAYLIVPVEQIELAVLDNRSSVSPPNRDSP